METSSFKNQGLPLLATVATFSILCILLYVFISVLNAFPVKEHIVMRINIFDILVGTTIYIKTSIDFALFIGKIMASNPGWKKRIAIEVGTALGNALGTFMVLIVWFFFKEAPILMGIMIILAALVLLRMAEEGFGEFLEKNANMHIIGRPLMIFRKGLAKFNGVFTPVISKILPSHGITQTKNLPFFSLLFLAFTVPFILGLDDFAGYIPLFSIVNVFGFSVGVFLAHMLLNIGLFSFPNKTIALVKNPIVIVIGSLAFIVIALFGLVDAFHILSTVIFK